MVFNEAYICELNVGLQRLIKIQILNGYRFLFSTDKRNVDT